MDRYGWFLSDGSIRSNLEWERFCEIKLPLPPMETQRSIVNLYNCLEEAKKIASEAREKLKELQREKNAKYAINDDPSQKEINRKKLAEARKRNAEKYGDEYIEVTDDDLN